MIGFGVLFTFFLVESWFFFAGVWQISFITVMVIVGYVLGFMHRDHIT